MLTLILFVLNFTFANDTYSYYEGVDSRTGERCGFTAIEIGYKNNYRHPLMHYAVIDVSGKKYYLQPELNLSEKKRTVKAKPDLLTATIPYRQGAKMFRLYFERTKPVKLSYVNDFYYDPRRNQHRVCIRLRQIR
tara:strand:+ start:3862 stop:4266 length:405 start_codon:yes stop_codon:yes gene_type:complete